MAPGKGAQHHILNTENIEKVASFEIGNRAHDSVSRDGSFFKFGIETAKAEPGTLLKLEEFTDTTRYIMPPGLSLSRFIFQSLTSQGAKVPVLGFVLWPHTAAPHDNGLPVVAWSHGTSGATAECAPSNMCNIWYHFQVPHTVAQAGYVVVATNYAGLGVDYNARGNFIVHEYMMGPARANDLLFSVQACRALERLCPDRLFPRRTL